MEPDENGVYKIGDGDVYLWVEQGSSIQLKAATKHGDPVELSAREALELSRILLELIRVIDD